MQFDYYYGNQAEQFTFYRIPKVLFTDPKLRKTRRNRKFRIWTIFSVGKHAPS